MNADPYSQGLRLTQAGRHAEAISAFKAALARDPDDLRILLALAGTARALGMADAARSFYEKVLAVDPQRLEALVGLGDVLREQDRAADAVVILHSVLTHFPESPQVWCSLGMAQRALDRRGDAEASFTRALQLAPDYGPALGNLGDCLADRGEVDAGIALYDRLLAQEPGQHAARLNRAILHFLKGDLKAGWRDYAARLSLPGNSVEVSHGLRAWSGGSLKKTRLLVTAEQGVGDQVMFASVIPELCARAAEEGGHIILECEPRLQPLFTRSFPSASVAAATWSAQGRTLRAQYDWLKPLGGANAAIEMGTLPRFLRPSLERFPAPHAWLVPDQAARRRWHEWANGCGGERRIGVCWRSGQMGASRALQYAPLDAWANFLSRCEGEIVCAQYDAGAEEIAALSARSGRQIHIPPGLDQKRALDETCAMLSALDFVVAAPTAVSWLASGAGVSTLKLVYDKSWTAFARASEPFAPSCRVVGPAEPGDWQDVFAHAASALR